MIRKLRFLPRRLSTKLPWFVVGILTLSPLLLLYIGGLSAGNGESTSLHSTKSRNPVYINHDHIESRFQIRNAHLREGCHKQEQYYKSPNSEAAVKDHLIVNKKRGILYCSIEKIGCTFWKRVFQILSGFRSVSNPFKIKGIYAYEGYETLKGLSFDKIHRILNYATKFMFVREPYERLMSGYVDKLFSPNAAYWSFIGKFIVKSFRKNPTNQSLVCGHDVTFPEFVQYFIYSQSSNQKRDAHFVPSFEHCRPCELEYDYIGKLETFKEDTFHILKKLKIENLVKFENFQNETDIDAIHDAVDYVYSMRKDIIKCMTLNEALFRTWRKLQIRGVLSKHVVFPYSLKIHEEIKPQEFKQALMQAYARSGDSKTRKKNREEALVEAYSAVTKPLFNNLKRHLSVDTTLFAYEDVPNILQTKILQMSDTFRYFEFPR